MAKRAKKGSTSEIGRKERRHVNRANTASIAGSPSNTGHLDKGLITQQKAPKRARARKSKVPIQAQPDETAPDVFGLVVRKQRLERFFEETGQRLDSMDPKGFCFEQQLEMNNWDAKIAAEQYRAINSEVSMVQKQANSSKDSENDSGSSELREVSMEEESSANDSCQSTVPDQTVDDSTDASSKELSAYGRAALLDDFKILAGSKVTCQAEFRQYLEYWNWNLATAWIEWRADRHEAIISRLLSRPRATTQPRKRDVKPHSCRAVDLNVQDAPSNNTEQVENDLGSDENNHDTCAIIQDLPHGGIEDLVESPPKQIQVTHNLNLMESIVPFNDNMEQERRDSAVVLAHKIGEYHQVKLSKSEAIFQLHLANWDLSVALQQFHWSDQFYQSLSDAFDHMRTEDPNREDQSLRLAVLLNITQRPDIFSVRSHLQIHNWNLIAAVVAWFDEGIKISKDPKARRDAWRRKDHDKRPHPMPTAKNVRPTKNKTPFQWTAEPTEFVTGGMGRKRRQPPATKTALDRAQGFILGQDTRATRRGVPKYELLSLEYIQRGTLKQNTFHHQSYKWLPDSMYAASPSLGELPVFDWGNEVDIVRLRIWRKQAIFRISLEPSRSASQAFTTEMNDFLYDLSAEYAEELARRAGVPREKVIPFVLTTSVRENWHRRFNARFVGTQPAGFDAPVEPRSSNALITQRARIPRLCEDFKVNPNTRANKRKRNAANEIAEDSTSDVGEN